MSIVPRESSGGASHTDTVESKELVLGALKSYPRMRMKELSKLLDMPAEKVCRITLRLIATGSVVDAFDRAMDEFIRMRLLLPLCSVVLQQSIRK
ncbi:MAG: hypothetical protein EAX81_07465 [Candidatus Thorarchaeota archaeon]|nr:hypothetical protein [Candidatus Thorarchaeota archaeon]